jgi:excisionase family DNA binding protein
MADDTPESTYITVPELARRLRMSKQTAYSACQRGEIVGAFRIGRRWWVHWAAFERATETAQGRLGA